MCLDCEKNNKPENYDLILLSFKNNKVVNCLRCKKIINNPLECEYISPGCFCKKCSKICNKENYKVLGKALGDML